MLDKLWDAYYNVAEKITSKIVELYFNWFKNQPLNTPSDYGKLIGKLLVAFLIFDFVLMSFAKWLKKKLK